MLAYKGAVKESATMVSIQLDPAPSTETLRLLWHQFEADPLRPMLLADTSTFLSAPHFLAAVGNSILPFVPCIDGEPVGIAWLYNIAMVPPKMTMVSGFVAAYVLPQFRSKHILHQCASDFLNIVRGYGLEHLWAEVRTDNMSPQYLLRACGFDYVATLPAWKRYDGIWQDMALFHRCLC
mgnify:CR=1 FL=1